MKFRLFRTMDPSEYLYKLSEVELELTIFLFKSSNTLEDIKKSILEIHIFFVYMGYLYSHTEKFSTLFFLALNIEISSKALDVHFFCGNRLYNS